MTLEEAIKHCEEVAEENEKEFRLCPYPTEDCNGTQDCRCLENGSGKGCLKCASEHRQLAKWLKELKEFRERNEKMCEALSEKFAYMNTCLNEREIILYITCGKQRSGINHCNTDCQNTECKSYRYLLGER